VSSAGGVPTAADVTHYVSVSTTSRATRTMKPGWNAWPTTMTLTKLPNRILLHHRLERSTATGEPQRRAGVRDVHRSRPLRWSTTRSAMRWATSCCMRSRPAAAQHAETDTGGAPGGDEFTVVLERLHHPTNRAGLRQNCSIRWRCDADRRPRSCIFRPASASVFYPHNGHRRADAVEAGRYRDVPRQGRGGATNTSSSRTT